MSMRKVAAKNNASVVRASKPVGFVIGWRNFAKISAVEGIHMSAEMIAAFEEFDRMGLSAAQRRAILDKKYGQS